MPVFPGAGHVPPTYASGVLMRLRGERGGSSLVTRAVVLLVVVGMVAAVAPRVVVPLLTYLWDLLTP